MAKAPRPIPPAPDLKLVPPDQEKATLEAIGAAISEVRRELNVGFHVCHTPVLEGLRDSFLLRAAAARRCFSVPPWFLPKLLKILESDEAYRRTETD
jgi:hypothetical protein